MIYIFYNALELVTVYLHTLKHTTETPNYSPFNVRLGCSLYPTNWTRRDQTRIIGFVGKVKMGNLIPPTISFFFFSFSFLFFSHFFSFLFWSGGKMAGLWLWARMRSGLLGLNRNTILVHFMNISNPKNALCLLLPRPNEPNFHVLHAISMSES